MATTTYQIDFERVSIQATNLTLDQVIDELAQMCASDYKEFGEHYEDSLECYYVTKFVDGEEVALDESRADSFLLVSDLWASFKQSYKHHVGEE